MSPHTPSPESFPTEVLCFPKLRELVIVEMVKHPDEEWDFDELDALGDLFAIEAQRLAYARLVTHDWRENMGMLIIDRDLSDLKYPLPKWVALQGWLTPESAANFVPEFVGMVAKLALSRQLHLHRNGGP